VQLLTFELDETRFAIPLDAVREVLRAVAVTPLPGAPEVVMGVIDVRGEIVPVFDLRARLGEPSRAIAPDDQLIVARAADRTVALQVDHAEWMTDASEDAVYRSGAPFEAARQVSGVARLDDGLAVITDLDAFLSHDESRALDGALAERAP
jgi:purine-binding chemotaxis protein CheW